MFLKDTLQDVLDQVCYHLDMWLLAGPLLQEPGWEV